MKGYINPPLQYEPKEEDTLVGCKYCRTLWREKMTHYNGFRINGPLYIYDYCDNCKDKSNE